MLKISQFQAQFKINKMQLIRSPCSSVFIVNEEFRSIFYFFNENCKYMTNAYVAKGCVRVCVCGFN